MMFSSSPEKRRLLWNDASTVALKRSCASAIVRSVWIVSRTSSREESLNFGIFSQSFPGMLSNWCRPDRNQTLFRLYRAC